MAIENRIDPEFGIGVLPGRPKSWLGALDLADSTSGKNAKILQTTGNHSCKVFLSRPKTGSLQRRRLNLLASSWYTAEERAIRSSRNTASRASLGRTGFSNSLIEKLRFLSQLRMEVVRLHLRTVVMVFSAPHIQISNSGTITSAFPLSPHLAFILSVISSSTSSGDPVAPQPS